VASLVASLEALEKPVPVMREEGRANQGPVLIPMRSGCWAGYRLDGWRYQGPRSRYGKAMAEFVHDIGWNLKDSVLHEVKSDYSCDIRAFTEEAARRAHQARLDEVLSEVVQSSRSRVRL
jgi:hypothetical protein